MCRLLYSYHMPHNKKKINDFLQQSDHQQKYTPGLRSESDAITHPDGFGLAWYSDATHKWKTIKSHKQYKQIDSLPDKINEIAVSNIIIGHIRRQSGNALPSIENTHPFTYRNQLFVHNGYLYGFEDKRESLMREIDRDFHKCIKGETDTELMFYLFLTYKRKCEETILPNMLDDKQPEILKKTIQMMIEYLDGNYSKYNANIIYANKTHSVILRYSHSVKKDIIAPSLYLNGEKKSGQLLISSEPIMDKHQLIPTNTLFIVFHNENKYQVTKI